MARVERRLDSTLKLIQAGMKMLVKMQQETREYRVESQKDIQELRRETREFKKETRDAIDALIAAQMRSEVKVDRLVAALLGTEPNGRGN